MASEENYLDNISLDELHKRIESHITELYEIISPKKDNSKISRNFGRFKQKSHSKKEHKYKRRSHKKKISSNRKKSNK